MRNYCQGPCQADKTPILVVVAPGPAGEIELPRRLVLLGKALLKICFGLKLSVSFEFAGCISWAMQSDLAYAADALLIHNRRESEKHCAWCAERLCSGRLSAIAEGHAASRASMEMGEGRVKLCPGRTNGLGRVAPAAAQKLQQ
jgi:hypothetical protein